MSQFHKVEPITEDEIKIEWNTEIILEDVKIECEEYLEENKQKEDAEIIDNIEIKHENDVEYLESVEEVKQTEDVNIEYVEVKQESVEHEYFEETYDALAVDCDKMQEESSKDKDSSSPVKRRKKKIISCPVCNKMIDHQTLKQHMRTHTREKPYFCEICGESFSYSGNLVKHKQIRHSEPNNEMYRCKTCDKSFKRPDLLKDHQRREKKGNIDRGMSSMRKKEYVT